MDVDDGPCQRVRRLCDERAIISAARQRTRYWRTDVIDDAGVLSRLCDAVAAHEVHAERRDEPGLMAKGEDIVAQELATNAARILREHLVATLIDTYGLERLAADACNRAGIAGREGQVAYCLVVLCQKPDPPRAPSGGGARRRRFKLDVGEDGFADQLESWADTIAGHVRAWSADYAAIHDEAERLEITTLSDLIPSGSAQDDIADRLADALTAVLTSGQRLEDMSIRAALTVEPLPGAYVFQSPLGRWVRIAWKRVLLAHPNPVDPADERLAGPDDRQDDEHAGAVSETSGYRALVTWLAGLASTRGLLSSAIDAAKGVGRRAAATRSFAEQVDAARFLRFRAELAHVIDELEREQRSFGAMLAYVVLAMRRAVRLQRVAILSLRSTALDDEVIEHIAQRMRDVVDGDAPPIPSLIAKTERASRAGVPKRRVTELTRLRDDRQHRAATFAALARMLDDLPATVSGRAAIGKTVRPPMTPHTVSVHRAAAAAELQAVDMLFARSFRRYAREVA